MLSPRHRVFSVCFSRQEVTCAKFRRAQPNVMSASLYIFYLHDWQKRRGSDQTVVRFHRAGDVNPSHRSAHSAIMLPISISSSHHVYEMEALPCAGWCDPQIDSFIRNDKRWVWTGLLIWQSLECQRDGWWRGPPLLSPPSPSPWLRPLIPPPQPHHRLHFPWPSSRSPLTLKEKYQIELKLLAHPKQSPVRLKNHTSVPTIHCRKVNSSLPPRHPNPPPFLLCLSLEAWKCELFMPAGPRRASSC